MSKVKRAKGGEYKSRPDNVIVKTGEYYTTGTQPPDPPPEKKKEPKEEKITASISEIVCPHCGQTIGQKTGDVYAILDKRFVKIAGQTCPKCGKML